MSRDCIVFTVAGNYYALEVEWIERIIQIPSLTAIPNAHPCIEGMMSYEHKVTKVVNFRKMTDLPTYEEELGKNFGKLKNDHVTWVKSLKNSIENGTQFHLTTDPHTCELGKWLDNYSTHDTHVLAILKVLRPIHSHLHEKGKEALVLSKTNPKEALSLLQSDISSAYENTIKQMDKLMEWVVTASSHAQKLLIYRKDENFFAIKVDTIEDIARIENGMIKPLETVNRSEKFLETEGVVEMGDRLVNVIKSVRLPTREERV